MMTGTIATRWARTREVITSWRDATLFVRMIGWSVLLAGLKHAVPLPALVRMMAGRARAARGDVSIDRIATLARWACRVTQASAHGRCLERGLMTFRYLTAAGVPSCLVVGMSASDINGSRGHAWIQIGDVVVGEPVSDVSGFTRVMAFDVNGLASSETLAGRPVATR
jgi:hypothetical protein